MKKLVVFMMLWLMICFGMLCAADVVLDLSKAPGQIEPIQLSMNIDQIKLVNFIPGLLDKYNIKIEVLKFVPQPLELPATDAKSKGPCDAVKKQIAEFDAINKLDPDSEWNLAEYKIAKIYEDLEKAKAVEGCDAPESKTAADKVLSLQERKIAGPFILKEGDQILITVTRGKYVWAYSIYRPHGDWFMSYGFSFISPFIYKPDKFFIKAGPEGEQTFLLMKSSRKVEWYDLEFVPSVFFWWMPAKARKWNVAPTAGLGFDTQSPVVFAGLALVYNYNIGVNFGFVFHKLNFLKDKYVIEDNDGEFPSAGAAIKENLSDDQLYDSKYRFNLFLSVTFRFGSDPFKSGEK